MFLFIGGWGNVRKSYVCSLGRRRCPHCLHKAEWTVYQVDQRATAYFVPVLTYSSQRVVICSRCGAGAQISDSELAALRGLPQGLVTGHSTVDNVLASLSQFVVEQKAIEAKKQNRDAAARRRAFRKCQPELVAWADALSASVVAKGFTETSKSVGKSWDDGPLLVVVGFVADRMFHYVCLADTPQNGMRVTIDVQEDAGVAKLIRQGHVRVSLKGRLMFVVQGRKRLQPDSLERWMQTVGPLALPEVRVSEHTSHSLSILSLLTHQRA